MGTTHTTTDHITLLHSSSCTQAILVLFYTLSWIKVQNTKQMIRVFHCLSSFMICIDNLYALQRFSFLVHDYILQV